MARPEGSEFTQSLRIRMTDMDKIHLQEKARKSGMSVSEYVRHQCSSASVMLKPSKQAEKQRATLIYELNKVGVNLNQLAKNVHYGDTDVAAIRSAIEDLQAVLKKVLE